MKFYVLPIVLLFTNVALAEDSPNCADPKLPRSVGAIVDGHKFYAYGEFDVCAVSPDYDESVVIQKNNASAWRKIAPKKSWEITSNLLGLTPTRTPSSCAPELEPCATTFLVDGNPTTVGFAGRPVGDPTITRAWVRIDLPRPVKISSVGLRGSAKGARMPTEFDIRVFNWNLWQRDRGGTAATEQEKWKTVYSVGGQALQPAPQPTNTAPAVYEPEETVSASGDVQRIFRFDPVVAREVWLTSPDDFYLSAFEVYDEEGRNVALLSKGCGVTVSGERYLFWLSEQTQASLWQMNYDLGIKWLRVSYYLSPLIWTFVERQKGVYTIDPYLDGLITQARECGIEVCLTLGPPNNPCYGSEQERINGFANYVRFMVKHFKGRVGYYEILNEYYNQDSFGPGKQGPVDASADSYVRMALPAAKAIREIYPDGKIILCGPCPLVADWILTALKKGMAKHVDVLSWHPYSFLKDTDDDYAPEELDRPRSVWAPKQLKTYADSVAYLRNEAAKLGFRGELMANESGAYAIHANRTTNLIAAKYLARSAVLHTALNVPMFWNETTSLMRPAWQPYWGGATPDLKPSYSYYILRTLCTLLDGARLDSMAFQPDRFLEKLERYSFALPGGNKLLAVWMREKSRKSNFDDYEGIEADIGISAPRPVRVIGIDLLNGREQDLTYTVKDDNIVVPGLLIKDYPLLLRLEF